MARKPVTRHANDSQPVPVYQVNGQQAEMAYQACVALQKAAARQPELMGNDYFLALLDTANARFRSLFEAL